MKLYILLVFCYTLSSFCVNSSLVNTSLGQIRGNELFFKEKNKTISVFQGIPFAKPPVGDLRFKRAQPIQKWDGIWDSTYPRSSCMQTEENGISEDCLFLDIYVPHNHFNEETRHLNKSVMFWIYGGAFLTGSISEFNSTYLSLIGDVIVVEVNYRLSTFGFLYDGSEEAPGNQALSDFLIALEFVQKNIEYFGGNPHSVTIFGQSAGSMSVSALIMMKNRNLFQRAIMESGSVNSYFGSQTKESALAKAIEMAKHFNCFNNETKKVNTSCLREIDPKLIVDYDSKMKFNAIFFAPIFGDDLLPTDPSIALQKGDYNKNISLLFGTCKDEGAGMVSSDLSITDLKWNSPNNSMSVSKAKLFIQLIFSALKVSFAKEIAEFYTKGLTDKDGLALKHAVADAFGDYQITCPTVTFGSTVSTNGKAYAYTLTYSTRSGWTGVEHSDELQYIFGNPLRFESEEEKGLSSTFIHIWTTFAKTGKPPKVNGIEWPEAIDKNSTNPSLRYMALNPKEYKIVENAYKNSCEDFWRKHLSGKSM